MISVGSVVQIYSGPPAFAGPKLGFNVSQAKAGFGWQASERERPELNVDAAEGREGSRKTQGALIEIASCLA